MKLKFMFLGVLLYLTTFDFVMAGKPKSRPKTTTPEPVTFPYGIFCEGNNGWAFRQEKESRQCCKEKNLPCKKYESRKFSSWNCVTRNHEERDGFIECCKSKGKSWGKGHLTTGEDC